MTTQVETERWEDLERLPHDFMQYPYEVIEHYRARGRIHHVIFPHGADVWFVVNYNDVRDLLQDSRVSKDGRMMTEMFAHHTGPPSERPPDEEQDFGFDEELTWHMLNSDPPRHTRLRSLVSKAFTLRRMEALRPRVEHFATTLLDRMEGKDEVEMVSEFTLPMPIMTICDVLGIPAEDQDTFRRWAVELVGAGQDPEVVETASKNVRAYALNSIEEKRRHPGEDLISALVKGREDDKLTDTELVSMIFLFAVAGHVTSMHTLTNGIYSLLRNPDQAEILRNDLSLMPQATDELMRFDGGVGVATFRFTKEPIEVGDVTIPANQILALSILGAHRDPKRYPNPNKLDVTRKGALGVLGFGHGIHFCIGQPLAKIQSEVTFSQLLTRYPKMRLLREPKDLRWEQSALLRGLITMPVSPHG